MKVGGIMEEIINLRDLFAILRKRLGIIIVVTIGIAIISAIVSFYFFDLPPILPVTDAQIMANQCDASILVIRSKQTEKEGAIKAKTLLEKSRGKLLGVILNDHEYKHSNYYYGAD